MFAEEIEAKFLNLWRAWKRDPSDIQMPGGESLAQVQQRAIAAFKSITQVNQGQQVLMVTHDVVVRLLVAYCLNVSSSIYRRLEVANASLSGIQVINGDCRLRLLNDTGHLGS
jgi:broad specificity phosphatase PhoE